MAAPNTEMNVMEAARQLAELGYAEKALQAYAVAMKKADLAPADRFEAACAVLQYSEDYKGAYDVFLELFHEGTLRGEAFSVLTDAFYLPNEDEMKKQYENNCRLLQKYPYLFRKDFLSFEELPVRFYPYDDNGVIPYYEKEARFGSYTNVNEPVVRHYFFRDLDKPVLAKDIFSQYELEYLKDNVRRSDLVAKENHIYLHYSDWGDFCSHLQVLNLDALLKEQKFVFLIGDEIAQYPIDFKERFGIDYSEYTVKPVAIREVNKIIWHTQLYCHNGGDFFNEILHGHPYLLADTSSMFQTIYPVFENILRCAKAIANSKNKKRFNESAFEVMDRERLEELVALHRPTLKDAMVTFYLGQEKYTRHLDPSSRIVPAIVYQPHFGNMKFNWRLHESRNIIPECSAYSEIKESGLLQQFKYIKTFTPMRRATTSHAAGIRFMYQQAVQGEVASAKVKGKDDGLPVIVRDALFERIMNRSFMVDDADRLMTDSRIVRFEDGKLNPVATFTALAEFMDVPYAKTMTYCSDETGIDPVFEDNAIGFDPAPVYRTYDEYADEHERRLMEYLWRDVYEFYDYGFQYYDNKPMTHEDVEALLEQCHTNEDLCRDSWQKNRGKVGKKHKLEGTALDEKVRELADEDLAKFKETRLLAIRILRHGLGFCSPDGKPLRMMEPLKLDPALLQTELYH